MLNDSIFNTICDSTSNAKMTLFLMLYMTLEVTQNDSISNSICDAISDEKIDAIFIEFLSIKDSIVS